MGKALARSTAPAIFGDFGPFSIQITTCIWASITVTSPCLLKVEQLLGWCHAALDDLANPECGGRVVMVQRSIPASPDRFLLAQSIQELPGRGFAQLSTGQYWVRFGGNRRRGHILPGIVATTHHSAANPSHAIRWCG